MNVRGWNRCDRCNRFAKADEIMQYEDRWLGLYGDLYERWGFVHKDECP